MALGVDGMRAGKVVRKAIFLTLGTLLFVLCLTMLYQSMRAVMDIGGSCASGGPYEISRPCPTGVGWVMPVSIFGMFFAGFFTFLGVFPDGGPRPYVFAWSALFLALGWNFLDYGFDAPGGGTAVGWLICGFVFVAMGGAPLLFLLSPRAARWSLWGPDSQRADDHLHPYQPPPVRTARAQAAAPSVHSPTPYARPATMAPLPLVPETPTAPTAAPPPPPTAAPPPPSAAPPAAPLAAPPGNPAGELVARLATLADLRERGMLDDDEYERAKAAVLDEEPSS
jgi:Short C-terminal domain